MKESRMDIDVQRLKWLCQKCIDARRHNLLDEISSLGRKPFVLDEGTIVLPAGHDGEGMEKVCSLVAHYDNVHGSYGYNDNGMALVAVLGILDRLPPHVEIVLTNGEECGASGSREYLRCRTAKPLRCVNIDVCGFGDKLYLDRMNSTNWSDGVAKRATCGMMPFNDAKMFVSEGVESVCVSTSIGDDFRKGIDEIWRTIHNNSLDNRLDLLNFRLLDDVREALLELVGKKI